MAASYQITLRVQSQQCEETLALEPERKTYVRRHVEACEHWIGGPLQSSYIIGRYLLLRSIHLTTFSQQCVL